MSSSFFMDILNSIPILQFSAPIDTSLVPHESSQPIQTCSYRLSPQLITLVQNLSFLGEEMKILTYTLESLSKHMTVFA